MKKSILISLVVLALVLSVWTPTPATAKNVEVSSSTTISSANTSVQPFVGKNRYLGYKRLSPQAVLIKVRVVNNTGGRLTIRLASLGVRPVLLYRYTIAPGRTRAIPIEAGRYKYKVIAICGTKSDRITFYGGGTWTWTCQ